MTIQPALVEILLVGIGNPTINEPIGSWTLYTHSYDNYKIESLDSGLEVNFFCEFPCKTCNLSRNDQCLSCYDSDVTKWVYFWKDKCLDTCEPGYFNIYTNTTLKGDFIYTCDKCASPCKTCQKNSTDCLTCIDKFLYYENDHSCWPEITWYFPFLGATLFFIVLSWLADCCYRQTNILHCLVYFLSYVEMAIIAYLIYIYYLGEVKGDRSLTMASFAMQLVLNLIFIVVHTKGIIPNSTMQYKQLQRDYKKTFWFFNYQAYFLNWKMSLMLISYFFGIVGFAGKFNQDNWQIVNTFSVLYILGVFLPMIADYYSFFMEYGLRHLASFIAGELIVV